MKRLSFIFAIVIAIALLYSACSHSKVIPEKFYKEYKATVIENSSAESVSILFRRPALHIEVRVPELIDKDESVIILEITKAFATVDNINRIAEYAKWSPLWDVYLTIVNGSDDTVIHEFYAGYFKTSDASDYSPENIDGYETWRDITGGEIVIMP